jgi:hypothetical protein
MPGSVAEDRYAVGGGVVTAASRNAANVIDQIGIYQAQLNAGPTVHCTFVNKPARTANGFCEHCGAKDHRPVAAPGASRE